MARRNFARNWIGDRKGGTLFVPMYSRCRRRQNRRQRTLKPRLAAYIFFLGMTRQHRIRFEVREWNHRAKVNHTVAECLIVR